LSKYLSARIRVRTNAYKILRLEERRKVKGSAYYERKKAARRQLAEAQKNAKVDNKTKEQLASFGY
jgi:large subunit ribosomal protein L13Ae